MAKKIFVKSSSDRKEAFPELSTPETLADDPPSFQFYQPF